MNVAKRSIELKERNGAADLTSWKWLQSLIENLGEEGMSSDESDRDMYGSFVLAKRMPWRRECESYMDVLDEEHLFGSLFKKSGHCPERRIRKVDAPESARKAPKALPEALYKPQWVEGLENSHKHLFYSLSEKPFKWMYMRKRA